MALFSVVEKTEITQPEVSAISISGITEIATVLAKENLLIPWRFTDWHTGTAGGRFSKRLGKALYDITNVKIPPEILSKAGQIAESNKDIACASHWDITDDFSWSAGDYGDRGSCFWQSYSVARDVISLNGGLAFRMYENGNGRARLWLMPINKDEPDDNWIAFNAYSKIKMFSTASGMDVLPGMVSSLLEWTGNTELFRRKVVVSFSPEHLFYLNGGTAYLISRTQDSTGNSIRLIIEDPTLVPCSNCDKLINVQERKMVITNDGVVDGCRYCYPDAATCYRCGAYVDKSIVVRQKTVYGGNVNLCPRCASNIERIKYSFGR
jgi:hypothetical protein